MLTRREIVDWMVERIRPAECVRAAWLGGADATGRADEMSDIDIVVLCSLGSVEACVSLLRDAVSALTPIAIDYRLPMPTWHGFDQGFLQLAGVPEFLMIDWMVIEATRAHPWFEVERHGDPVVLVDKDGLVRPVHVDRTAISAAVARRLADARLKFPMFRHLAGKMARRNLPIDAASFHHALVVRTLVDVLRCVHCPDRFDYGLRYLQDDLPPDLYARLVPLLYPADAAALEALAAEAARMFEEAVGGRGEEELRVAGPPGSLQAGRGASQPHPSGAASEG